MGLVKSATRTFQTRTYSAPSDLPQVTLSTVFVGSATFSVSEPCDRGGYSRLSYSYELRSAASNAIVTQATFQCCELVLSGLLPSQAYTLHVRADNTIGQGNWTELLNFSTPSGLPSTPSTALLYASSTKLELSISPPVAINTSALSIEVVGKNAATESEVFRQTLDCSINGATTTCPDSVVIDGLDETQPSYTVLVRAIADGGSSDWSADTYTTDSGEPGTLGFRKTEYNSIKEEEYLTVDIARLFGTTVLENVTFEIADTIAFTVSWTCEQTSLGASCYASEAGDNSGT